MDQTFGSFEDRENAPDLSAVAIVGMSCRFAGVHGTEQFWDLLREGREGIETYSEEELLAAGVSPALLRNPRYVRRGAPLADMECFDAALFGLSQRDAAIMDPQHRHFLECAWEALEDAGHTPQGFGGVIGVFAGSGHNAYMPYNLLGNRRLVRDTGLFLLRHTGNDKDFLTTRASYLLDLKGPSINVQTACSTSLVAIHMAAQSLLAGECDMVLAGGVSIELPHRQGYLYEEGEILSPDGRCRPFDASSQGTVFGSGVAVLALRRLSDAIESGDHIHAVLRGSAINNDGSGKVGYLAPGVEGQAAVIAEALAVSGIDPSEIDYVEAHGTGTPIGDPIEVAALTQVFRQSAPRIRPCGLGSVKANIGHTDTAAGAAGVIKVALAMRHEELPAVPHFEAPNPDCAFATSPLRVQASREPWPRRDNSPRRAGVSSLGVGGTNAHVVLEEAPPRAPGSASRRHQLLTVSGQSETAAQANLSALAAQIAGRPEVSLADAAFTLSTGRRHLGLRRFAVAKTERPDLAASVLETAAASPPYGARCIPGRSVAFLFCGGGPQHVDMARGLYETEPLFRAEMDRGLDLLDSIAPNSLRRWLFPAVPDRARAVAELERPSNALPALYIVQTALARLWMSLGIVPAAMIGHSCGEYAAAHISGVIDLESGLRIVHARGVLFEKTGAGGMLGVPLSEAELTSLLPAELSIAAINGARLCVVSGESGAISAFRETLAAQEIEAQSIPITVAAHSPMLDPILPEFRAILRSIAFQTPRIPFASNLTGDWVGAEQVGDWPEYWARHLREPVRFTHGLQRLLNDPERVLLEVGPGRTMASLARQHPDRKPDQPVVHSMRHPDQDVPDDARLLEALGELWSLGVSIDWNAYWAGERRLRIPLPTYRFDRQRHWFEPAAAFGQDAGDADPDERMDLGDWTYEPVWTRVDVNAEETDRTPVLVLRDEQGLSDALIGKLRADGVDVVTVLSRRRRSEGEGDAFTVRPAERDDWAWLFARLLEQGRLPSRVYHCWLVNGQVSGDRMLLEHGLFALAAMAPELAAVCEGTEVEVMLVTDRAQCVAGDRGVMPLKATLLGARRVIGTEYPGLRFHAIDIEEPSGVRALERTVEALIREPVPANGGDVALRGGERWTLDHRPVRTAQSSETWLKRRGAYLITGGLGGIGLTIADRLARTCAARLVLVSRTALPDRARWNELLQGGELPLGVRERICRVLALEASGSEVELITADVAEVSTLRRGIKRAEARFGPIHGVFHTAGTIDDELVETRRRTSMEAVLRPKISGTFALERVFASRPPAFLMLFSSISAFAGLPGQTDYAAANAFLDAYAQSRRHDPITRVVSVGWSQWAEVGMAAALARQEGGDAMSDLGTGRPFAHPFLDRVHSISNSEFVLTGTLSPQQHWVLDEHRLTDVGALLPGTAYLELARTAVAMVETGSLELRDFAFLEPFAVPDERYRDLRVHVRQDEQGGGWGVVILGREARSLGAWTEHARGTVRRHEGTRLHAPLDLDAIAARCRPGMGGSDDQPRLRFGPRWQTIDRVLLGAEEALLHLEIPEAFGGELEQLALHPALLDFATAGAQALIAGRDPATDFYAPFTYNRLVLHAPLPARIASHVRYRGDGKGGEKGGKTAVFNVTITDPDGLVIAEVSDFTMIRVESAALTRSSSANDITAKSGERAAIHPGEGAEIVARLLSGAGRPHTIVSPYALPAVLARLRKPPKTASPTAPGDPADAPATETEKVIAALWSDLLGVDCIGRNDNFFDLGGHSLLAVQFTNRLRKRTGKALPLAAMLGQPTVAGLAAVLDPDSGMNAGSENSREGIVTIREGGSRAPLFLVHDGLGETLLYRGFALRLDRVRPVIGMEPLRRPDGTYAHTRIDEMAAYYIALLRTYQASGPYLLAGLCAGGVIAFEMARQLQNQGERVAFVGIIDAADVEARKFRFLTTRLRLSRLRAALSRSGSRSSGAGLLPDLGRRAWNALRWEIGSRLHQARDRRTVREMRARDHAVTGEGAAIPFLKLYEVAHKEHRPLGIFEGGTVALFKAGDDTGLPDDTPYCLTYRDYALGWGKRVRDEIVIVDIPGGHSSNLQEPYVDRLAPLFQEALDAALASVEPVASEKQSHEAFDPMVVAAE
jgi:acyl transferase domain-containing protein